MWMTLLLPLLTGLFGKDGVIGTYISTKQAIVQKEQDAKLELAKANVELIKQQGINAVDSERIKLAATGQGFKFVTFILINIPVITICIAPNKGKEIFENFALIPVWYAQLYAAIYGIIWGLPATVNAMASIFSAIQEAWTQRQDKKIEKVVAVTQAKVQSVDDAKKEVYDGVKKAIGLLGWSQQQVNAIDPVLDKVLSSGAQVTIDATNANTNTNNNNPTN